MSSYGLLAVFGDEERLVGAARAMRERGYRHMEGYSPFPIDGLAASLGHPKSRLPWLVLAGGLAGAAAAYGLILYSVMIDYPINVGGRPLHSWPPFVVLAFEGGILGAGLAAFFGMLAANGLPEYYHPISNTESFANPRGGRFYLLVEARDDAFAADTTRRQLEELGAERVEEVPP